jgi:hypothetical protein
MSWQIAQNRKEAQEQHDSGFGYETKELAQTALDRDDGIDPYYKALLHVFEIKD